MEVRIRSRVGITAPPAGHPLHDKLSRPLPVPPSQTRVTEIQVLTTQSLFCCFPGFFPRQGAMSQG